MTPAAVLFAAAVTAARVVASATVVAAASATSASAGGMEFFGGGVADGHHLALEAQVLAYEGMVEVHDYVFVGDFLDFSGDAVAVGCHHRDIGAFANGFGVEFSVDHEDAFGKLGHVVGVIGEAFAGIDGDVEFTALFKAVEGAFQRTDHAFGDAEDEAFGLVVGDVVDESFGSVRGDLEEIVAYFDIFAGENLFHNFSVLFSRFNFRVIPETRSHRQSGARPGIRLLLR